MSSSDAMVNACFRHQHPEAYERPEVAPEFPEESNSRMEPTPVGANPECVAPEAVVGWSEPIFWPLPHVDGCPASPPTVAPECPGESATRSETVPEWVIQAFSQAPLLGGGVRVSREWLTGGP